MLQQHWSYLRAAQPLCQLDAVKQSCRDGIFCTFPQQETQIWVSLSFPHADFHEVCRNIIIFETPIPPSNLMEISLTVTGKARPTSRYQQTQFTLPQKTTLKGCICHLLNTRKELSLAKQKGETTATTKELCTFRCTIQNSHFPIMIQELGSQPAQSTAPETNNNEKIKDSKYFSLVIRPIENFTIGKPDFLIVNRSKWEKLNV